MEEDFNYTIELVGQVGVIRFSGSLTKQNSHRVEACLLEMQQLTVKGIVFTLKELKSIEQSTYRELAKIQIEARKQAFGILLVECSQELTTQLLSVGIIRPTELSSNIGIAINGLSRIFSRKVT